MIAGAQTCAGDTTVANQTLSGTQTVESCADLVLGPSLDLDASANITFRAAGAVRIGNGFSIAAGGQMSVESGATVEPPPEVRTFNYQDGPYFLTQADGPWGERDWTYDRIGNRTSETRDRSGSNETDSYDYVLNGSSGDTALLDLITLAPTGTADYEWDAAGNLDTLVRDGNYLDLTFDAASRFSELDRGDGQEPPTIYASATFLYDGRSFLRHAEDPDSGATVEPLYDSAGLLHALVEKDSPTAPERRHTLFYLAGRPVAQLTQDGATETWQYLTTDHLGTPLLAADDTGAVTWSGGFEPFGHDYAEGTMSSALEANVFLRLPGQWETGLWADAALGSGGIYYNVYRWHEPQTGRYLRPDPIQSTRISNFAYTGNRPLIYQDPFGQCRVEMRFNEIGNAFGSSYHHAYIIVSDPSGTTTQYRSGPTKDGPWSPLTQGTGGSASQGCCQSSASNSSNSSSPGSGGAGGNTGPWGPIAPTVQPWGPDAIDWPRPGQSTDSTTILDNDAPCGCIERCIDQTLQQIGQSGVPYNGFSSNSNAAAYTALLYCGLRPPEDPPVWAPGWGMKVIP